MKTILFILSLALFVSCGKDEKKDVTKKVDEPTEFVHGKNVVKDSVSVKIIESLSGSIFKDDLAVMKPDDRKFRFSAIDLNGDGKNEYFVAFSSSYFCGSGGCTVLLLNSDFTLKNKFTVVTYPVIVTNNKTDGWSDLVMFSGSKNRVVKHGKEGYPGNPSVEPVYTGSIDKDTKILFGDIENMLVLGF